MIIIVIALGRVLRIRLIALPTTKKYKIEKIGVFGSRFETSKNDDLKTRQKQMLLFVEILFFAAFSNLFFL